MWANWVFRSTDTAWHKGHIVSDMAGLCGMAGPYASVLRYVISYLYFWKKLDADKILLANTVFHNMSIQLCPMSSQIICVLSIWRQRQNIAARILNILTKSMKAKYMPIVDRIECIILIFCQFTYCWSLAWWKDFEHYFASMWNDCNCVVVWTFFGIALWD